MADLKKKSTIARRIMITKILDSMDTWDSEEVLEWAKNSRLATLEKLSIKNLEEEFIEACPEEVERL